MGRTSKLLHMVSCAWACLKPIASGKAREFDLQLAARVAAGALRTNVIVESLVTSCLVQFKKGLSDCSRQNTGAFAHYEALAESLGSLGLASEVRELLGTFHVNPKKLPVIDLTHSGLLLI